MASTSRLIQAIVFAGLLTMEIAGLLPSGTAVTLAVWFLSRH